MIIKFRRKSFGLGPSILSALLVRFVVSTSSRRPKTQGHIREGGLGAQTPWLEMKGKKKKNDVNYIHEYKKSLHLLKGKTLV